MTFRCRIQRRGKGRIFKCLKFSRQESFKGDLCDQSYYILLHFLEHPCNIRQVDKVNDLDAREHFLIKHYLLFDFYIKHVSGIF